jgi:hypothetical protein
MEKYCWEKTIQEKKTMKSILIYFDMISNEIVRFSCERKCLPTLLHFARNKNMKICQRRRHTFLEKMGTLTRDFEIL